MIFLGIQGSIKNQLNILLNDYPGSRKLINDLSCEGELLFFGGSIRDYCVNGKYTSMPRDFDIAIKFQGNYNSETRLERLFSGLDFSKNRFGGYKLKVEGLEFDIWDFNNTWAFREKKLEPEEENLAKSVYLSIDGVVYNYNTNVLYCDDLDNTLRTKELNIVLEENPQKSLNLLRALVFKAKYSLNFSEHLINQFRFSLNSSLDFCEELYNVQCSHYKSEYINKEQIRNELIKMM